MAKKDTGLKATLSNLGPKVAVKKSEIDIEKTDAVAKKIHADSTGKKDGKWVRITTDLPEEEFIRFKVKLLREGKNRKGQEVIRELILNYINQ